MYWVDTTPTTGSAMNSALVTGLTGGPATTTSTAESDLGSRPAMSVMSGEESRGGSETSAPVGRTTGGGETDSTVNVPVIATWPHAARTCGCRLTVASVP